MLATLETAALRTLLLVGVLQLCLLLWRVRRPQLLLTCWTAALAVSLAMPLLQKVVTLPILTALPVADFAGLEDAGLPDATSLPTVTTAEGRRPLPWRHWLSDIYCTVAGAMLLRLALGLGLSLRMVQRARALTAGEARGLRVRLSSGVSGPVTLGSTVLLPSDCGTWPEERLQAVIAHEAAHALAGDFYVLLLSQVNRAVFWFSPASWWLHHRLTMLAEMASDDAAVAELGDRVGYAGVLLDVARQITGASVGVAMARPATVERRIERILAGGYLPTRAGGVERILAAAGVLCLATVAAVSLANRTEDDAAPLAFQPPSFKHVAIDPALLDRYAGYYRNPGNDSVMVVTRNGDHLDTHRAGHPPVPEYSYTDRDFFLTTVPQQNTFVTDRAGAVTGIVHHQNGHDETLHRIDDQAGQTLVEAVEQRLAKERASHVERPIDPALLEGYIGVYALEPQLLVTITRQGNALYFQLTGHPAHEFHAYGEQDFFSTNAAAQISFVPGLDGRARALVLHQGGRDRVADRIDSKAAPAPASR